MPILINSNALTFDDVLLVPQHSYIASRKDVKLTTELFGHQFNIPLCSANMDTITGLDMAEFMHDIGGVGILHRYASHEEVLSWVKELVKHGKTAIPSIGIKQEDFKKAMEYMEAGALGINIDIAHGDSVHMREMVSSLTASKVPVIAGNVATYDGTRRLADAGARVIKVGVGPGSMCTTRIVTGHGVPQLTAIEQCAKVKEWDTVKIIADGGIRNAGDCVKALAFGADMVMIGSLLAGTNETPGKVINAMKNDKFYQAKEYRGMASRAARSSVTTVDSSYTPEGERKLVACKGPAKDVIDQLIGGIRSGFSYSGANTLEELQENAEYVIMSANGIAESKPHGV